MSADQDFNSADENKLAAKILLGVIVFLVIGAVTVMLFGGPALGFIGLFMTLVTFFFIIAFALGK